MLRLLIVVLACGASLAGTTSRAATFTVDTTVENASLSACTAAPGDCSFRGALAAANATIAFDTILFDIPMTDAGCTPATGVCRIRVGADFTITQPVLVDGYSQAGASPNTIPAPGANDARIKIEITAIEGFNSFRLFNIRANTEFRGLAIFLPTGGMINGFGEADRLVMRGNWFGVQASGASPDYSGNGFVFSLAALFTDVLIGGPTPADRNVIAGSGRDLDNLPGGGGADIQARSIAAGQVSGRVLVQGNLFGLAPDGIEPRPLRDAVRVFTGFVVPTPQIEILDNRFVRPVRRFGGGFGGALRLTSSQAMNATTRIQGNLFGLAVDGTRIGVERDHIFFDTGGSTQSQRVLIGGLGAGEGNVFAAGFRQSASDLGSAVRLPTGALGTFVEFVGNRMLGNAGIGLDFPNSSAGGGIVYGRTPNDADDADTGANNQQNHPRISAYSVTGKQFSVTYRVDSAAAHSAYPLRVDFYKALGDEGEVLLGSDVYALAQAQADRSVTLAVPPGVALGSDDVIVAIATDADGRSSEFSFDPVALTVTDSPDPNPAGDPFTVDVQAQALQGPFKPNGIVELSMNTSPPATCLIALAPRAAINTSGGSCSLIAPVAGTRTITATYRTLQGAFGSALGADVTAQATHTATVPNPEQVGFPRCRLRVLEGSTAQIRIERRSGGNVVVAAMLTHSAGTATPGVDYSVPPDQLLTWAVNDLTPRIIAIPIAADAAIEPVETFRLTLGEPVATALLPFAHIDVEIVDPLGDLLFNDGFEIPECLP